MARERRWLRGGFVIMPSVLPHCTRRNTSPRTVSSQYRTIRRIPQLRQWLEPRARHRASARRHALVFVVAK
eukprot:9545674-Lingulodinium_polyedra.AAC.1